jgi:selenocysteine lyase/cysteine desulfurase
VARLIGAAADDIILANSASYGLHLMANGLPWKAGDEILLMKGDFPSDIFPWLALRDNGVTIRLIEPRHGVTQADELLENITGATRLVCLTWVHSFSGAAIDLKALGDICRERDIIFFVNASQALGTRPLDISQVPVDALTSVGFKWLCGPYGTGFCWIRPEVRATIRYNQAYWLSVLTADDLREAVPEPNRRADLGARKYDVFGTANFFNFVPWKVSVDYILEKGVETIRGHNDRLVSHFIDGLDHDHYDLLSPDAGPSRSTLTFVSDKKRGRNETLFRHLSENGIDIAMRAGHLRISPHLHNSDDCIRHALSVFNKA